MTTEEIKAKAAEIAALYTAKANGKTLQVKYDTGWADQVENAGPGMDSDLSRWRVKPEPRRMWMIPGGYVSGMTMNYEEVESWKAAGHPVTEWQEVLQ